MQSPRFVRPLVLGAALCALVAQARAQDFNLDIGLATGNPVPAATFGGAAARPGTWGIAPIVTATPQPLTDITGTPTAVTSSMSGGTNFTSTINLAGATVDDLNLMSDIHDPGTLPRTWTFTGLAAGVYDIYTYAMAPDDQTLRTNVSVAGSVDPLQTIGGLWPNAYVQGVTHARHRITTTGGPVVVTVVLTPPPDGPTPNFGSVNGFQIVTIDTDGSAFCFGDGTLTDHTTPCPCTNGAAGNGCANSANPAGANLVANGNTVSDDIVLSSSGMPAVKSCVYLQGDGLEDSVFGDGVRCAGGTLLRLRTRVNSGGASSFPDSTDTITLSARGGVVPGSGAVRYYQTYYRNSAAAFCPPETFNVTNGWRITW